MSAANSENRLIGHWELEMYLIRADTVYSKGNPEISYNMIKKKFPSISNSRAREEYESYTDCTIEIDKRKISSNWMGDKSKTKYETKHDSIYFLVGRYKAVPKAAFSFDSENRLVLNLENDFSIQKWCRVIP